MLNIHFINSYASLSSELYSLVAPSPVSNPKTIKVNNKLAHELNLDANTLSSTENINIFAGNILPTHSQPLAQVYAGHQFGHFNPQLGDGRAILLGDILDRNGQLRDIQLKGSGPTPYSRGGDGRAAIGPVIREYILSEAMHALGIKTTRALAAVTTGDKVFRNTVQPSAIITRIASSHVRIGTFEYFRSQGSTKLIKELADFVIKRHYPSAVNSDNPYLQLLNEVIDTQASLIASWMHVGFIHGVMNTDNMSICGETIDYGPCAFMDAFSHSTVFSSIDRDGRYAYENQANIGLWNLTRFAECLLPLINEDTKLAIKQAEDSLGRYSEVYHEYWSRGMLAKIGITNPKDGDITLIRQLLDNLQDNHIDYTTFFRELSKTLTGELNSVAGPTGWITAWKNRLLQEPSTFESIANNMDNVNPIYIPRNHLVENAILAAETENDYSIMDALIRVLSEPFTTQPGMEHYATAPNTPNTDYRTFCGT